MRAPEIYVRGFAREFYYGASLDDVGVQEFTVVSLQKPQEYADVRFCVVRADACSNCEDAFGGDESPRCCVVDLSLSDGANDVRNRHEVDLVMFVFRSCRLVLIRSFCGSA